MTTPENGIYVLQGVVPAQIAAAPVAVKVVNPADDNGVSFTTAQVAQMESGGGIVLGYFSIGEAENYLSYFSSLSAYPGTASTAILGPQDPSWPGDYEVAYWTPAWLAICETNISQMIAQGFNGIFFDVVDECETSWAIKNAPGGTLASAESAMVSLVQTLANYAQSIDPSFQIWVNISGAEDLSTNSTFVNSINGAYEEQLFYQNSSTPQSKANVDYNLNLLDHLIAAGKPVIAVEYVSGAATIAAVQADAAAAGVGYYIADPNLQLNGVDTAGFDPPCFARGTRIATPAGEVPVERLAVGDTVLMLDGQVEPIVWIGIGRVLVTPGRHSAATPIIVRKNALADNVPHRDLRVTKGHSLFIDDVLIPAEFLVNHRSIVWDTQAREIEIYHIELTRHGVLLADGAPAESYRDDGNRWLFQNASSGWELAPKPPYAPVLTGGPVVDAIWRRLLDRAGPRPDVPTTEDPDLHLLVDGKRVAGKVTPDGNHLFRLLRHPSEVRVISRAGVPAELGLARDPRLLGVALRRILLWQGARLRVFEASDTSLRKGFHQFEETNGFRWTDGDALLPAALFDGVDGVCDLTLQVGCTAHYPLFNDPVSVAA